MLSNYFYNFFDKIIGTHQELNPLKQRFISRVIYFIFLSFLICLHLLFDFFFYPSSLTDLLFIGLIFLNASFCLFAVLNRKHFVIPFYFSLIFISGLLLYRLAIGYNNTYIWIFIFPVFYFIVCGLKWGLFFIIAQGAIVFIIFFVIDNLTWVYDYSSDLKIKIFTIYLFSIFVALSAELMQGYYFAKMSRYIVKLQQMSVTDPLTEIFNRRVLKERMNLELSRFKRNGRAFSVIMCDIDFFKKVNDTYGHDVGDLVLKKIALILKDNFRFSDTLTRYGGEEFLILMPETALDKAVAKAEIIRKIVEQTNFRGGKKAFKVTISLGVYSSKEDDSIDEIIKNVDQNLYKAKNSGRNKVCG